MEDDGFKQTYLDLLAFANYYEVRPKHTNHSITSDGFAFILDDARTQVQNLLLHYMRRV
jgi:hypothetical protein